MTDGRDPWPDPLEDPDRNGRITPPPGRPRSDAPASGGARRRMVRLILGVGALGLAVRVAIGVYAVARDPVTNAQIAYWVSSSLVLVGVPGLLAWLLVRRGPRVTIMQRVMDGTTLGLLLVAMLLGEGAVCVMFVAPLAYGTAAAVTAVAVRFRRRGTFALVLLLVPVMQPLSQDQVHEVTVTRVIEGDRDDVVADLADGPDFHGLDRPWLLTLGYPVPHGATRAQVRGRVEWTYEYGRGATTFRMVPVPGGYDFRVVEDTAMTRWFRWDTSTLTMEDAGGRTRVELTLRFDPALGPDWYFGTIEGWFMRSAGDHLLDALGMEVAS